MRILITALLVLVLASPCASAATIRVPADQPTIQAGIDGAADGDTVLLADGVYTGEGNRDIRFYGKAITLRSENGPENCIVDAESSEAEEHTGFTIQDDEDWATIVDGLTITGGSEGVYISGASPVIRNCTATSNEVGIYVDAYTSYALVESSRIVGNAGRGIWLSSSITVLSCEIRGNTGGGINCSNGALILNCLIAENTTPGSGGGIFFFFGDPVPEIRNCTIVDNTAENGGGGLFTQRTEDVLVENCILTGNSAAYGDQYALSIGYPGYPSRMTIRYSDVVGDTFVDPWSEVLVGPGMLYEDPLFAFGPGGAYYLSQTAAGQDADSPCVDAGNPAGDMVFGTTRTDSVQDGGVVDMGYHSFLPGENTPPDTLIRSGPENGRGVRSPVAVFTFGGTDEDYQENVLQYSWRHNAGPWSDWSAADRAALDDLGEDGTDHLFEVRSRNPRGDIDPSPARRSFSYHEWIPDDRMTRIVAGPGPGPGNPPLVRTGLGQWLAYSVMRCGVNVAAGDIDGDGTDEVITGPGPGEVFGPHVRCFEPDGAVVHNAGFLAYGTNKYGVKVAAGDVDGDGIDEIITGAGPGAVFGPHVRGWNWDGGPASTPIPGISFFAYGTLRWGVNVACGDLDGDGTDEIITGAGPGAVFGPHVRGWRYDGSETLPMSGVSYFAFATPKYGVNVSAGDLDGDGIDEIITGAGPGPTFHTHVRAWDYDGVEINQMPGVSFFAFPDLRFGAVVGAADVDDDGLDELLTLPGPGPSNGSLILPWSVEDGEPIWDWWWEQYQTFDRWLTHGGTVAGSKNGWE